MDCVESSIPANHIPPTPFNSFQYDTVSSGLIMSITLSQVTQRTPNLGDRVRRYGSVFTRAGSGVVVHQAIMRGETVIVKDHRYVGHGTEAMKVLPLSPLCRVYVFRTDSYPAHPPRGLHLVISASRKHSPAPRNCYDF